MSSDEGKQEIEITPEMIEAGVAPLSFSIPEMHCLEVSSVDLQDGVIDHRLVWVSVAELYCDTYGDPS